MKQKFFQFLAALLVLFMHVHASGEDIDLFVGVPPATTEVPNVLFVVDNTANWNTAFANEKSALVSVFSGMPLNKFRTGLMMFTESGGGDSGQDGAYVRAAARLLDTADTKSKYAALINALDINDDKSNGGKVAKAMEEAYLYLTGGTPHAGNNKNKTDYTGNTAGRSQDDAVHALAGNALASKTATTYVSPTGTGTNCVKNYIIYISNGPAQDNSSDITQATAALSSAGGRTTTISISPSGSQDNPADEWARFLKRSSLKAAVYTLDVNPGTTGQGPGWTALLMSMASQSGGRYFAVTSTGTQIQDAINSILSEILSVNSVFASVSLPVSVNTQGTYLNQVYVGMFRPDGDGSPRWLGNLKQYKMGLSGSDLRLQDADGAAAINNQTGFVTECARSYWTPTTVDTEWAASSDGASDCLSITGADGSNYPDGNQVAKGGHAYRLRATASRSAYTCASTSCTSVVAFNSTNVTAAMLGVSSSASDVVDWALGADNRDNEDLDGISTDRRLSSHGDVVHSRPVAINFGSVASPNVAVFYGGNDGWFRAINGNRSNDFGTHAAGNELWAFMPEEFVNKLNRLRERTPLVYYPGTPASGTTRKDYAMDGPVAAYRGTIGSSSTVKTFVYSTMRRGGRSIYAFDVSNMATTPSTPTLAWRVGCTSAGTCTTGMSGIGQTWGAMKTFTHANYSSGDRPLLIFGGGYDTCEDYDSGGANHNCTSSSKGHYVYVLDAETGSVVSTLDTGGIRGIIADVVVVPGTDGHAKYGYVVDLGGDVYRIDFNGAASAWRMDKIASLGCDTTSGCTANRKFMFAPSVINTATNEYTLLVGSGDREKPITAFTAATGVTNYFFSFVDKPTVATGTYPGNTDGCGSNIICLSSLLRIGRTDATPSSTDLGAKKGWYLGLNSTEQVVTQAITIFSQTTFSTHEPAISSSGGSTTSCTNLGTTRVYNVNYRDAAPRGDGDRYEDVAGDGLPPSATAGLVTLDTGQTVPFCIGCSANSPLEARLPTSSSSAVMPKGRTYWYIERQ